MRIKRMTPDLARRIYRILVEECGADSRDALRKPFCASVATGYGVEFHISSDLGCGGKFWRDRNGEIRVSCYPEHETPERLEMIRRAMARFEELEIES